MEVSASDPFGPEAEAVRVEGAGAMCAQSSGLST